LKYYAKNSFDKLFHTKHLFLPKEKTTTGIVELIGKS